MSTVSSIQFVLFSVCVYTFTLFTYLVYYGDSLNFNEKPIQRDYDFVIVGSGTAGSLIAHRLSKETNYTFIVLEAGGRGHALLDIPVLGPFLHRSVFDWKFETTPQDGACMAMENNVCRLPQGKIVGGSFKLNNMIYTRGNASHYVEWFHGKHNLEYVQQQFDYIENHVLHLNNIQYQSDLSNLILEAAKELGYDVIDRTFKEGFAKTLVSQKNGKRWTTSDNVKPEHVVANAMVESIIFNGRTATGVNVAVSNKKYQVFGRIGVILSAGVINTPKILQLSGIGPKDVLDPLNIPILQVLPVGENLQDHVGTGLDLVLFNKSVSVGSMDMINPLNFLKYFMQGKGPLTTPGCEAVGFVSTKKDKTPDIQYMILPLGISEDRGTLFTRNLGIKDEIFQKYFAKNFDKYSATFLPTVLHAKSKGRVYINSRNPYKHPVYDPKYLSNREDIQLLINGLNILREIVQTDTMKSLGAEMNKNPFPGCEDHIIFSDSYFECYIRHLTMTTYHPVGTCSMGLPSSKDAVVDLEFRVIGIQNLYVVDASVLPTLPSANINAAVAMMASLFFDSVVSKFENNSLYCHKNDVFDNLLNVCSVR